MKTRHGQTRDLAAALRRSAGAVATEQIRGTPARRAVVDAVASNGTITTTDSIVALCTARYATPMVGDVVILTRGDSGSWYALDRLAGGIDPVGETRVALKTTDTTLTSTTSGSSDPQLHFTVTANAMYVMDGWIKYSSDPGADISLDWAAPTGSLGEWTGSGASIDTTASANGYQVQLASMDLESARSYGGAGTGVTLAIDIKGTLRVGPAGGTYQMLWNQRISQNTATTVYADSWLRLHRIA